LRKTRPVPSRQLEAAVGKTIDFADKNGRSEDVQDMLARCLVLRGAGMPDRNAIISGDPEPEVIG
jgi:hypothetical protein